MSMKVSWPNDLTIIDPRQVVPHHLPVKRVFFGYTVWSASFAVSPD
jgi:hypothetical protein